MRALWAAAAAAAAVAVALAGCGAGETVTVTETATEIVATTETVTATETAAADDPTLPAPVAETRAALLEAADSGDYERLRPLVPDDLRYSFGETTPGGAVDFWLEVERATGDSPIRIIAGLLRLPPTYSGGFWVWPFAYAYESVDRLGPGDRALLQDVGGADLSGSFLPGAGYAGWRLGIAEDGAWQFFVTGD